MNMNNFEYSGLNMNEHEQLRTNCEQIANKCPNFEQCPDKSLCVRNCSKMFGTKCPDKITKNCVLSGRFAIVRTNPLLVRNLSGHFQFCPDKKFNFWGNSFVFYLSGHNPYIVRTFSLFQLFLTIRSNEWVK